jgi:hypothetical protein
MSCITSIGITYGVPCQSSISAINTFLTAPFHISAFWVPLPAHPTKENNPTLQWVPLAPSKCLKRVSVPLSLGYTGVISRTRAPSVRWRVSTFQKVNHPLLNFGHEKLHEFHNFIPVPETAPALKKPKIEQLSET